MPAPPLSGTSTAGGTSPLRPPPYPVVPTTPALHSIPSPLQPLELQHQLQQQQYQLQQLRPAAATPALPLPTPPLPPLPLPQHPFTTTAIPAVILAPMGSPLSPAGPSSARKAKGTAGKDPKTAKEKKSRSRAACLACKATKQRCDGPSRIPCRRCELYGLECKFMSGANTVLPPTQPVRGPNGAGAVAGPSGEGSGVVTQKLYEIATRLQSIEAALSVNSGYGHASAPTRSSPSPSQVARSLSAGSSDDGMDHDGLPNARRTTTNPIQEVNESTEQVVGPVRGIGLTPGDDFSAPDVLNRGILTAGECQELFEFFFCSIHPWVMMLSLDEDRDALAVRSRSPLLFHTILLLSTSYSTPFPSQLHTTMITYTNSILAPQILSPQPHELTTDFLRAIDLLNLYKPTQLAARRVEGKNEAEAMRTSKVNGLASWMLQGILARTAERLELASIVPRFSRAYSAAASGSEIPAQIVRDLRLYYWLLSNDVHGNVQSGRRCNMEGHTALATTRIFSSLQLQPYDTRLAASVEMFEVARPILRSFSYERTRRISQPDLDRYNQGMAAWEEFWLPVLQQQLAVDPLAMSVLCPFAWFITLTYNAAAYVSWKQNRMYGSDSGGEGGLGGVPGGSAERDQKPPRRMRVDGPRGLSQCEMEGLERCVRAAEGLIFTLSEESRVPGGWRKVQWDEAERADGWRKLVLDESVVQTHRWGMDAITCVAYIFPLVFLGKLVNEGILTVDLVLVGAATIQPPWQYQQKFPRLLELGASFLDAIALNPHHPAKAQAQVLRTLLDTGVKGRTPSPQLPRHAATVMTHGPDSLYASPQPVSATGALVTRPQAQVQAQPQGWQLGPGGAPPPAAQFRFPETQQQGQQQRPPLPPHLQGPPRSGASSDSALTAVLDGFDPLFGETGNAFWEWGGMGAGEVDWAAVQASMRH